MSTKKKIRLVRRRLDVISGLLVVFVAVAGPMLVFGDELRPERRQAQPQYRR